MNVAVKTPGMTGFDSVADTLLRSMGVDGLYARTALYERAVDRLTALLSQYRTSDTEIFRFPPLMSRAQLEKSGYLKSFPHLLGCVNCLQGSDAEINAAVDRYEAGGDWTGAASAAETVLSPAACYPVYPIAAGRGPVPEKGYVFDVACDCFRHEPSRELDRLQSFRMREYVCIGSPQQVEEFRDRWILQAKVIADGLMLPYQVDRASDPFFGRVGQFKAIDQVERALKFELLVPLRGRGQATACMSFNYHKDHFGRVWDLRSPAGETCHTACVAFGMDRLAVALFVTHGVDCERWPEAVRSAMQW